MAKKDLTPLPRPELLGPLNMPTDGKVHVIVKGRGIVKSDKPEVMIERKD